MTEDHHVTSPGPLVLTIGNDARREFADTICWLDARASLCRFHSVESGVAYLRSAPAGPVLIVWLQAYPGQFSESDVAQVRAIEPATAMVCVYGALSEGEMRTGKPLPGIARIPWYAWEARMQPSWPCSAPMRHNLSDSTTRTKLESPAAPRPHPADRSGEQLVAAIVAVASASKEMAHLIISACETAGHVGRWIERPGTVPAPVEVAIWDDSSDGRHPVFPIEALVGEVAPAPIIATMSFPRLDDRDRLARFGVKFVLGKPLMIEDLLWQIEALIKSRQSVRTN